MIKSAAILCILFSFASAKLAGSRVTHPSVLAGVAECSKKEGIDVQTLFEALKTEKEESKMLNYNYCIMNTVGFVKADGTPDLKVAEEYTQYMFPEVKDLVLKTCYNIRGEPEKVAWGINKCLSDLKLFD